MKQRPCRFQLFRIRGFTLRGKKGISYQRATPTTFSTKMTLETHQLLRNFTLVLATLGSFCHALATELRIVLISTGQPKLTWVDATGVSSLESSLSLNLPVWTPLTAPDAQLKREGEVLTATDQRGGLSPRFYRLRAKAIEPPSLGNGLVYDIGNPTWQDLFVDPIGGSDDQDGRDRLHAFKSLRSAWMSLPILLTQATRIRLLPGSYREAYLEARHGTFQFPILIEPADGPDTVTFESKGLEGGSLQFFDASYVYLQDFRISVPGGDGLHLERCDHFLFRRLRVNSVRSEGQDETVKINQSQYIFIEDCDISDAGDNCIDLVAVQHGHIVRNKLHNAQDWVIYLKGGSAYFTIEGNEIYGGGTGGLTCGQGTGFQFMSSPWIHYEAYDIKVINNVIHDCEGAGLGVNGGYNILMAHNTLYRVGSRSHMAEFVHGSRGCDGDDINACLPQLALGGWGTTNEGGQFIPNKHILFLNNVLYSPSNFTTGGQFLTVAGPLAPPVGSNLPNPSRADDGLVIRGNIFWAKPLDLSLGIEDPTQGCQEGTCTEAQLRAENHFNDLEPDLINAAAGDFRPLPSGRLASQVAVAMPNFSWNDAPTRPLVPPGSLENRVERDRRGTRRPIGSPPGAVLP